jgi:hypothetical protein
MKKKGSSCMQMKDHKGKPSGLMMEGSAMHMSMLHQESAKQEKKDLMKDMPVDDKASAMEMSPYKMDHEGSAIKMGHESPAKFTGMSGGSALHTNHDKDERSGEELKEVTVTGDASKVGAYRNQLNKAFEHIQNTLDTGGFGHGTGAQEAGLGYVSDYRKELARLRKRSEEEGPISTLRYMRRRSDSTVGGSGIPGFLSMPK